MNKLSAPRPFACSHAPTFVERIEIAVQKMQRRRKRKRLVQGGPDIEQDSAPWQRREAIQGGRNRSAAERVSALEGQELKSEAFDREGQCVPLQMEQVLSARLHVAGIDAPALAVSELRKPNRHTTRNRKVVSKASSGGERKKRKSVRVRGGG